MIDLLTSTRYYDDHLQPVWDALPDELRGRWFRRTPPTRSDRVTVVASFGDAKTARRLGRPVVFTNHGAGQQYDGWRHPAYPAAVDRDGIVLITTPNQAWADVSSEHHPNIPHVVVGCPKLDAWWNTPAEPAERPVVVLSTHHRGSNRMPETRSALSHYRRVLRDLATDDRWRLLGHGHPLIFDELRRTLWLQHRIPPVRDFDEVLRRGHVYVCDNSSTMYEFAATGRPVVCLNAPWYRRDVEHGLRFWSHPPGIQVDEPDQLIERIALALADQPALRRLREQAVAAAYSVGRDGTAARRTVDAILSVL